MPKKSSEKVAAWREGNQTIYVPTQGTVELRGAKSVWGGELSWTQLSGHPHDSGSSTENRFIHSLILVCSQQGAVGSGVPKFFPLRPPKTVKFRCFRLNPSL